jgi:sporadic carbohydrate cluster protein (TIGR04323 family)
MKDSYLMLNELVYEIPKIDGIVAFSLFQLPEDKSLRRNIYKEILGRKGEIHFALEGLSISNNIEINRIENIWSVRQTLPSCPKRIVRL